MIFDWYNLSDAGFNYASFMATGLPSRELQIYLDNRGLVDLLITRGNLFSVLFDNVLLSLNLNNDSPFVFEQRAIYQDVDGNIWIGVQV